MYGLQFNYSASVNCNAEIVYLKNGEGRVVGYARSIDGSSNSVTVKAWILWVKN